jgi:hypothetical protein
MERATLQSVVRQLRTGVYMVVQILVDRRGGTKVAHVLEVLLPQWLSLPYFANVVWSYFLLFY